MRDIQGGGQTKKTHQKLLRTSTQHRVLVKTAVDEVFCRSRECLLRSAETGSGLVDDVLQQIENRHRHAATAERNSPLAMALLAGDIWSLRRNRKRRVRVVLLLGLLTRLRRVGEGEPSLSEFDEGNAQRPDVRLDRVRCTLNALRLWQSEAADHAQTKHTHTHVRAGSHKRVGD